MTNNCTFTTFAAKLRAFMQSSSQDEAWDTGSSPRRDDNPFNELALELCSLQFAGNPAFRQLCQARQITPTSIAHWSNIPAIPTAGFKEFELTSLPAQERTTVFHSSGTTEQRPSRHFHNARSLAYYEAALVPWFQAHLLPELGAVPTMPPATGGRQVVRPTFLCLTPPAAQAPHSSLVHMFETVRGQFGADHSRFVAVAGADGSWQVDLALTLGELKEAVRQHRQVILLGTAFSFVHLLDELARQRQRFDLPPGSRVLETGGYKGRSRALSKAELHGLITERLGIPPANIISEYGMSELSSQAYDTVAGKAVGSPGQKRFFRFPPWARVQVISPETGREAGEEEAGLLRIWDLANAWSVMAIQTEDLGLRRSDGFELIGRAALAEPRGCSLMAR